MKNGRRFHFLLPISANLDMSMPRRLHVVVNARVCLEQNINLYLISSMYTMKDKGVRILLLHRILQYFLFILYFRFNKLFLLNAFHVFMKEDVVGHNCLSLFNLSCN